MKKLATIASSISTLAFATPAFAQTSDPTYGQGGSTSLTIGRPEQARITDIGKLISNGVSLAIIVAGVLVFIYLVMGGIQWITSGGDKVATEKAQQRITAAVIGLAIVAASWALVRILGTFFGVNIFDVSQTLPKGY